MQNPLFPVGLNFINDKEGREAIGPEAYLLRRFVTKRAELVLAEIETITALAPFRHMVTRGGFAMSVAMTNCGNYGWLSDRKGYRYSQIDPHTAKPWPAMPTLLRELANEAAAAGGFTGFEPDACLINRYEPGARMGLHQDRDETDFAAPIVSVSLGLPAVFQFGSESRKQRPSRYLLESGDVVVWGSRSRLFFHGVLPLAEGTHPLTGRCRINLTFRKSQPTALS